jgi:hypothetical protein
LEPGAERGIDSRRQSRGRWEPALFDTLERNDILFIDSSHIIRPGGDVLTIGFLQSLFQL